MLTHNQSMIYTKETIAPPLRITLLEIAGGCQIINKNNITYTTETIEPRLAKTFQNEKNQDNNTAEVYQPNLTPKFTFPNPPADLNRDINTDTFWGLSLILNVTPIKRTGSLSLHISSKIYEHNSWLVN
jgi:hypothetical protein